MSTVNGGIRSTFRASQHDVRASPSTATSRRLPALGDRTHHAAPRRRYTAARRAPLSLRRERHRRQARVIHIHRRDGRNHHGLGGRPPRIAPPVDEITRSIRFVSQGTRAAVISATTSRSGRSTTTRPGVDRSRDGDRRRRSVHLSIVGGDHLVASRAGVPCRSSPSAHHAGRAAPCGPISRVGRSRHRSCVDRRLQPERRAPHSDLRRILKHRRPHITVHCTVTRQRGRDGYIKNRGFCQRTPTCRLWFSLYAAGRREVAPDLTPHARR